MKKEPLILCLTNTVAAHWTANCLLAVGAKPAMVEEPAEAAELASKADALLVNLGTVTSAQAETMRAALAAAQTTRTPWVLDPVGVQYLSFRRRLTTEFLSLKPSIVRGNHAEIAYVLGEASPETTLLSTGETDFIYTNPPNASHTSISGGTPLLQAVTGTGCAQGGLCAAFLGWGQTPEKACATASQLMKRAGERASAKAKTPGAFQIALLNALWELTHD